MTGTIILSVEKTHSIVVWVQDGVFSRQLVQKGLGVHSHQCVDDKFIGGRVEFNLNVHVVGR